MPHLQRYNFKGKAKRNSYRRLNRDVKGINILKSTTKISRENILTIKSIELRDIENTKIKELQRAIC